MAGTESVSEETHLILGQLSEETHMTLGQWVKRLTWHWVKRLTWHWVSEWRDSPCTEPVSGVQTSGCCWDETRDLDGWHCSQQLQHLQHVTLPWQHDTDDHQVTEDHHMNHQVWLSQFTQWMWFTHLKQRSVDVIHSPEATLRGCDSLTWSNTPWLWFTHLK